MTGTTNCFSSDYYLYPSCIICFHASLTLCFYVYQPSSSSRAAEALSRESGVIPGFVGFDTTANLDLSYVPAVHGVDEIDNLVDAEFRLVLRKMSKRDVTTRLKVNLNFYKSKIVTTSCWLGQIHCVFDGFIVAFIC